ncbi:VapE domain-containing protein [Ralstonia pseudosolanacearum]|uniref:VapE domain-containing protein n=1 Tax=Ralstonia pseudosolanacearum TaxID=1310165 RepID=UPI000B9A0CFD|nr:VapE domain-containing protein [Ralstonia sp. RS647]AST86648.1 hypothetical protein CIG66_09385 [Ralstonia pseudosolanacearum]NKA07992.1 DNA primase [Ralstonia solanacearum]QKL61883.1 toprim domain-containing protein [Ralstonia solanacearum]QKL66684.1 toprim domain-containing protein [Ralstonia solanacearum]QKM42916.1 toprim domain-containing protein [Ralstonia solanacearum]
MTALALRDDDVIRQFLEAMSAAGLRTSAPIEADGDMHRVHIEGERKGTRNGWYVLHLDGTPAGGFGNWRTGTKATWCAKGADTLTATERADIDARIEDARKRREADERERQKAAAKRAQALWDAADEADCSHPYLTRKNVFAHGLRVAPWALTKRDGETFKTIDSALLVPIRNATGKLTSLQAIFPAVDDYMGRDKDMLRDGLKKGCFHIIGAIGDGPIAICEGYATGATVHEATGWAVAVAFDAYNLRDVGNALRKAHPRNEIVFCADNDQWTHEPIDNPGVTKASEAAKLLRCRVIVPEFADLTSKPTDFNDLAQCEGLDAVRRQLIGDETLPVPANDNTPAIVPLDAGVNPYGFPHLSDKGQPLNSRENLQYVLDSYGITTCYNEITKRSEVRIPGFVAAADTYDNSAMAEILSICARNRMPQSNVVNYLGTIAGRNPHNPVRDWIMSKPWDGVSRFAQLAATIEPADGYPVAMRDALLRRWLISAVAAVFKPHGFEAHGALVFTGPQGAGKTRWFKRLAPADSKLVLAGAMLDPSNKDTILTAVGHWIVELGELDATFRKADIARLKSFITQSVDKVRKPYALTDSEFQRRTVFCASVNEGSYLVDDTGNRRWWTVAVERIDYQHSIDMQQVWAEVLTWFQSGEQWHLTDDENVRLNAINEGHEQRDAIADKIYAICGAPAAAQRGEALMLAGDVCVALGFNPDRKNKLAAAAALRKLVPVKRDRNKTDWFLVPGGIHHRLHDNSSRVELPDENAPF